MNHRRSALKQKAVDYLGGHCTICSYNKTNSALEFHHIDDFEKDFNISSKMSSWKRIEKELKKCVLLCANCHREVHDGFYPEWIELEYSRSDYEVIEE